ncbi:LacI family DNA-binding transcriptional regulator [Clostridium sp. DL1XJH146]
MAVTINDVAKEAGVSITTVSRVLNNNYPVKKETREIIEKAIEKLNYNPNAMARSLITKKTSMIGVVVPGITNLFFTTIVEEFEISLKKQGYSISLSNTGGNAKEEKKIVQNMISRQVDAILLIDPAIKNLDEGYYEKISKTIPTLIVNGCGEGYKGKFLSYDEKIGTEKAFEYLVNLNHRRIAFIRGGSSYSYDIKENIYQNVIQKNKFSYKKIIRVGGGNSIHVVDEVNEMVKNILLSEGKPTAIFACNEIMAIGVVNACKEMNIDIPEEISIVGCDNTYLASISSPKLSTVDLKIEEIGKRAAKEIFKIIENNLEKYHNIKLKTSFIKRESCGEAMFDYRI